MRGIGTVFDFLRPLFYLRYSYNFTLNDSLRLVVSINLEFELVVGVVVAVGRVMKTS